MANTLNIQDDIIQPILGAILKPILWGVSCTRLPQSQGMINIQGIENPVEILRDQWGGPHIYAGSIRDALFAQGFVHAQERLW